MTSRRSPGAARRRPRASFALLLLLALAAACATAPPERTPAAGPSGELTLLYFNDLHGHLVPFTREGDTTRVGGAARMATLVQRVREENRGRGRPTLVVFAGDLFQGTPLSSVFQGEPDFRFLNAIGLDAMVLGNHEFDFGLEVLQRRVREAEFPVLAANVRWRGTGRLLVQPHTLLTLPNGLRVGIVGLVTDETPRTTDPRNVQDLVFEPPLLAAAEVVPALAETADVRIALTHLGSSVDRELAEAYDDELHVVVGGHDQVLLPKPLDEEDVLITQAEEHGLYLGRLDLVHRQGEADLVADTIYRVTAEVPEHPAIAGMVASYVRRLDRELGRTVGRLGTPLEGDRRAVRTRPTNFGVLLASLMREAGGADVALLNGGAIRSSIPPGPVTLGEILQALPFANRILTVELPGEALAGALERSLAQQRVEGGGYLQVAGVTVGAAGEGPLRIRVGEAPLDPRATYTVAITDFLYHGGDGYGVFRRFGRNPRDTGRLLAKELERHIRENSPLSVPPI